MTILPRRVLTTAAIATVLAVSAIVIARPAAPAQLASAPVGQTAAAAASAPVDQPDEALAADLEAVLAADQSSPSAAPSGGARVAVRGQLRHLAAWRKLVHATVVVDLRKQGLTTVQLDHGTVSASSATSLTIRESGGGTVTVTLGAATRVRRDGARATVANLKAGDDVFALSGVTAGDATAYLVVVPKG